MHPLRLLGASMLAAALLPLVPTAAQATPAPAAAPSVPCLARQGNEEPVPSWHGHNDTMPVTQQDLDAIPAQLPGQRSRLATPNLPTTVTVPVYVHIIKGRRAGERDVSGPTRVRRIIKILNGGFHAKQLAKAHSTRYTFALRKIDTTVREGWYHAWLFGPRDRRMKRALHRGGKNALNLYINGGGPDGYPILGWSAFPWRQQEHPLLDGVTVNWKAMPGGTAYGYNRGDTVIHEVGHWMGLFHTFQGGCGAQNDSVVDTPAEAEPSFYCDYGRDTCESPGVDPVHNFMDYSLDSCMVAFTQGQIARMDYAFARWRG